jgi:hypothetical protein
VVLDLSCRLLRGPFGLRLGVASHLADSHLDGTLYLVSAADDPIFVMSWVVFLVNTRSRLKVPKNIRMVDAAMVRDEFRQIVHDSAQSGVGFGLKAAVPGSSNKVVNLAIARSAQRPYQ